MATTGRNRVDLTIEDVLLARRAIGGRVRHTPVVVDPILSERHGSPVSLKLECWQETGSFKLRGALSRLAALTAEERHRGLIVMSAGNHALGVARGAAALGLDLVAVMPRGAPAVKVDGVRRLGAEVRLEGETYDDASEIASALARDTGRTLVHPFADPAVMAGQGTIGLELAMDGAAYGTVVVPAGGGGLLVGIAVAVKALAPGTRVIGAQSEASPPLAAAYAAGRAVPVTFSPSLADGLHGDTTPEMVALVLRHADGCVAVSEASIRRAMRHLFFAHRLVVEGAGAAGVAALMEGRLPDGPVTAVISGGNVDPAVFLDVVGAPADAS